MSARLALIAWALTAVWAVVGWRLATALVHPALAVERFGLWLSVDPIRSQWLADLADDARWPFRIVAGLVWAGVLGAIWIVAFALARALSEDS